MRGEGGIRQVEPQFAKGVLKRDAPPMAAAASQARMEAPQLTKRHLVRVRVRVRVRVAAENAQQPTSTRVQSGARVRPSAARVRGMVLHGKVEVQAWCVCTSRGNAKCCRWLVFFR